MGILVVERLGPALGAELSGVDFSGLISADVADALRQALLEHMLLLVRGQVLSDDEHLAFVSVFGRIAVERAGAIRSVSNEPDGTLGPMAAAWHSDFMFFPHPFQAISLYGLEIPSSGTQTRFANGVLAASTLPADLRTQLAGLEGRALTEVMVASPDRVQFRTGRRDGLDPHQLRPVLWPHPASGEPILAVWEQQTDAIFPLEPDESDDLLEVLFAHLYRPDHVYVHEWQRDDLLIWDNLALQHSRPYVGQEEPRILRRICVGEEQGHLWEKYASARS